ncbi:type II secretion system protein GspG [Marinicauda salina]|uniref:Type II secretion system core protein G n=1 Tax=Marinicauda salina TaxID=2135793 RepID=A0A2U2BXH1_9PROT|nr:type II secretion system major pseudopilin GspG [Marinicauda salina]PWE18718.1 type II secretion system protein GspG [Marinicauda salina]
MMTRRGRSQNGFTLFELLVVLAILALLAAIVAPRVIGYLGRAKSDVAETQMSNIVTALELYYLDMGRYPSESEGLQALVEMSGEGETPNARWQGPYLDDESGLIDPWGRPYVYARLEDADRVEILTYGRDGEAGGDGEDADITKR